jgi:hypothetical protein
MRLEIRNRHFTTCDKGSDRREDAERNYAAAEEFDQSSGKSLGITKFRWPAECSEQFLHPVAGELRSRPRFA